MKRPAKQLTSVGLRRMINEVKEEILREKKSEMLGGKDRPEDVPAKEEEPGDGDVLEKHVNFYNALKLEESRLTKRLKRIAEAKVLTKKKIVAAAKDK